MAEPNLARTHQVTFLILKEMRTPMLVLIVVYAVAILGMT